MLRALRDLADPSRLDGMARYGVDSATALGVTVTELRMLARTLGRDHRLALALWATAVHEARILATIVDDPDLVTRRQMDSWIRAVRSWDLCDQACGNLFDRTPLWSEAAEAWCGRPEEFVKRGGFALMATSAVHRRDEPDERFESFLPLIRQHATDDRPYVRKAVNWALRQIGKRSATLHRRAVATAQEIRRLDARSARWIAANALRELQSDAVRARLGLGS